MNRFILLFSILLVTGFSCYAQLEKGALKLYEAGVSKFREEKYKSADSLFTLSLNLHKTAKTFFGRGAARYNFSNVRGYCSDMSNASYYGDEEAEKQFASKCVIIDTLVNDIKSSQSKWPKVVVFEEFTRGIYTDIANIKAYDKKENVLGEYFVYKRDTTFTNIADEENNPAPIVGYNHLITNFRNEINYPKLAKDKGITGTVLIEFIVEKDGTVTKLRLGRGIGYGCDEEALRVVNAMGKWTAGIYLGRPIKSLVELPIEFGK